MARVYGHVGPLEGQHGVEGHGGPAQDVGHGGDACGAEQGGGRHHEREGAERVALEGIEVRAGQRDGDDAQGEGPVGHGEAPEGQDEQDRGDGDPRDMQRVADVVPVGQGDERVVRRSRPGRSARRGGPAVAGP